MRKLELHELGRVDVSTFREQPKAPITIVLDQIRSGLNVGSAFRTADAFGLEQILLCGITPKPPHREILKTAIGASESVAWRYFGDTTEALVEMRERGYLILGVEQTTRSTSLQDFDWPVDKPLALVFGNEVRGLSEQVLPLLDAALEIPQYGTKHSLNVSVCLGIVVWECFRHWKFG